MFLDEFGFHIKRLIGICLIATLIVALRWSFNKINQQEKIRKEQVKIQIQVEVFSHKEVPGSKGLIDYIFGIQPNTNYYLCVIPKNENKNMQPLTVHVSYALYSNISNNQHVILPMEKDNSGLLKPSYDDTWNNQYTIYQSVLANSNEQNQVEDKP